MTKTEKIGWRMIVLAVLVLLGAAFCSCSRKVYVPVEKTTEHTDTLWRNTLRIDTVIDRDTVTTLVIGDTVLRETVRWRIRYRERGDTVYRSRTDSVVVPQIVEVVKEKPVKVEVVKEVEKPLRWWQKVLQTTGGIFWTVFGVGLLATIFKIVRRWKR